MLGRNPDSGGRTVNSGDIESETSKVDRIVASAAPEINSFTGLNKTVLNKSDKSIWRGCAVPRNILPGKRLVNPVDIGIFHVYRFVV
jgi:hypothetical protein